MVPTLWTRRSISSKAEAVPARQTWNYAHYLQFWVAVEETYVSGSQSIVLYVTFCDSIWPNIHKAIARRGRPKQIPIVLSTLKCDCLQWSFKFVIFQFILSWRGAHLREKMVRARSSLSSFDSSFFQEGGVSSCMCRSAATVC